VCVCVCVCVCVLTLDPARVWLCVVLTRRRKRKQLISPNRCLALLYLALPGNIISLIVMLTRLSLWYCVYCMFVSWHELFWSFICCPDIWDVLPRLLILTNVFGNLLVAFPLIFYLFGSLAIPYEKLLIFVSKMFLVFVWDNCSQGVIVCVQMNSTVCCLHLVIACSSCQMKGTVMKDFSLKLMS